MGDVRIIICPACGGEGIWDVPTGHYSHLNGALITETRFCRECGGSGQVEVEVEPITVEDLAEIPGDDDPHSAFAYRGGNP